MPNIRLRLSQSAYDALAAQIAEMKRPAQTESGVALLPVHSSVEDYAAALVRDAAAQALRQRPPARVKQIMDQLAAKQAELEAELAPSVEPEKA